MFACTKNGGSAMSNVPDVCKVPSPTGPIPIPLVNMAQMAMLSGGSVAKKVKISGGSAANLKSEVSMSSGDEAGTVGGVISNKFIGKMAFIMGSMKVKIEGKPAVRMSDPTMHNEKNAPGMVIAPSQTKVMVN